MGLNIIYVLIGMMAILVSCFLTSRIMGNGLSGLFTKIIASLGFVFSAVIAISMTGYYMSFGYILLGLVCGLLGDILLELRRIYKGDYSVYLNSGFVIFGIGHIFYLISILLIIPSNLLNLTKQINYLLPLLIAFVGSVSLSALIVFVLSKSLKLDFGEFKWQAFAYSVVLMFVAIFSLVLSLVLNVIWWMTAGLITFLASDLVLSLQYFGDKDDNKFLTIANHVLYYAAQMLIVLQIVFFFI